MNVSFSVSRIAVARVVGPETITLSTRDPVYEAVEFKGNPTEEEKLYVRWRVRTDTGKVLCDLLKPVICRASPLWVVKSSENFLLFSLRMVVSPSILARLPEGTKLEICAYFDDPDSDGATFSTSVVLALSYGVFFDGTCNDRERNLPKGDDTNVSKLYEMYEDESLYIWSWKPESLAQMVADYFGVQVHAFLVRSNYGGVLFSGSEQESERISNILKNARSAEEGRIIDIPPDHEALPHPGLARSFGPWWEGTTEYSLWRKKGGISLPGAGETPSGLSREMGIFQPRENPSGKTL